MWLTRQASLVVMGMQVAIRLSDSEVAALDAEVSEGRAASRSEAVRRAIARLRREQRYREEDATLEELARQGVPVYPDLDGVLDSARPPLD
jgi:Arc/MetJ-type ribon-helix-helix transcriptional regulator